MPGPKTIWVSDAAKRDLTALVAANGLSDSATIARALKEALERRSKNDACDCDESAPSEENDD
jgi:hypothetical protein